MERNLSYDNKFMEYDQNTSMSYGVVSDDKLVHDNMVPFFKEKGGYGSNDFYNTAKSDRHRDLFTGNLIDDWKKKQEVGRFFPVFKDLSYIYGTPNRPEGVESRYFTSRYRNNEKLFDEERVTPGLNLGYNEIGTQGYVELYRAYPKTVDELRGLGNPKNTYEGRIIPGLKGVERPVQAAVISYRPDGFKITTEADLLPQAGINTGPAVRQNHIVKETQRGTTSTEYTGGAYNKADAIDKTGPESMRPQVREPFKQTFVLPVPLQKYAKEEMIFNPNIESYDISPTARATTSNNTFVGPATNPTGSNVRVESSDLAKPTLREQMPGDMHRYTNVTGNTMRGTAIPMDEAKQTLKEIVGQDPVNMGIPTHSTQQKIYYTDPSKPTIKETTVGLSQSTFVTPIDLAHRITNIQDVARTTNQEMLTQIPLQTFVTPVGQGQRAPTPTDTTRPTIRETTTDLPRQTFTTPVNQSQGPVPLQDMARTTRSELTTQIPQNNFITPVGQSQRAPNLTDIAKPTTKETTVTNPVQTFLTMVNQAQGQVPLSDVARPTLREELTPLNLNTFITPIGQAQRAPNFTDTARTTQRQTTIQTPQQTVITPIGQARGSVGLQDTARTTTRELISEQPLNTILTGDQRGFIASVQDIARATMKEFTSAQSQPTFVTAVGQAQRAPNLTDMAKPTLKEITVQNSPNTFVGSTYRSALRTNPTDTAKSTLKEITVQNAPNTHIGSTYRSALRTNLTDEAKHTLKEITSQSAPNTFVGSTYHSALRTNLTDIAKTTTKEQTIENVCLVAPTYQTMGSGYGYLATKSNAPITQKQLTVEDVYIPPVIGNLKFKDYKASYNGKISDLRESTQVYRPPTLSGTNKGPAGPSDIGMRTYSHGRDDTFNQTPWFNPKYAPNDNLTRLIPQSTIKPTHHALTQFIDPSILDQLKTNPFSQPAYFSTPISTTNY